MSSTKITELTLGVEVILRGDLISTFDLVVWLADWNELANQVSIESSFWLGLRLLF